MADTHHEALIETLQQRFARNTGRHHGIEWLDVVQRLHASPQALASLAEMERTGGEPDVVVLDDADDRVTFCDCSAESPSDRRSLCYDQAALDARKENKPRGSAAGMATEMGIAMLTESQYRALQNVGAFDLKTSSWVATTPEVRKLGGALFCDRRYGQVFLYHNGAESYYAARGFRGCIHV